MQNIFEMLPLSKLMTPGVRHSGTVNWPIHLFKLQFIKKLQHVEAKCSDVQPSQHVEGARKLLQEHQDLKKSLFRRMMS